jgi:hypothetical protein
MGRKKKRIYSIGDVKVQVTPNVKMVHQSVIWGAANTDWIFVPATRRGFVFILNPQIPGFDGLLQGYTLYRPCALSLAFSADYTVTFETISMNVALERRSNTHSASWSVLGMVCDSSDDIPF